MTRQEFVNELANPTYGGLLKIYLRHKINDKHDRFFKSVENAAPGSLHYNRLFNEVKDLFRKLSNNNGFDAPVSAPAAAPKKTIKTETINLSTRVKIDKNPLVRYEDLPENLKGLYNENGKLQGEMKTLHAKMKVGEIKPAERKTLVNTIAEMETTQQENWAKIDKWWAESHTSLPLKKDTAPTPADTAKEIERCKKYIGRNHESKKPAILAKVKDCYDTLKKLGVDWAPKNK